MDVNELEIVPKNKGTDKCKVIGEPCLNVKLCLRNIREHKFKQLGLSEMGLYYQCSDIHNFKYEMLYKKMMKMKRRLEKMLGKFRDEQTLRMNWRELQYRKKVTDLLDVPSVSSWDIIYEKVSALKRKLKNNKI